jgi:hypothetical protein
VLSFGLVKRLLLQIYPFPDPGFLCLYFIAPLLHSLNESLFPACIFWGVYSLALSSARALLQAYP